MFESIKSHKSSRFEINGAAFFAVEAKPTNATLSMNNFFQFACALVLTGTTAAVANSPTSQSEVAPANPPPGIFLNWNGGLMTLPVEINARKGGLMIDTGAVTTSLRDSAAKELNVTLTKDEQATGAGIAGKFDEIMKGEVSITIPGQKPEAFPKLSRSHPFIPLAAAHGSGDFGVIGLDDLSGAGAVIDCVNGSMQLHPAGDFSAPAGLLEIPMKRRDIGESTEGHHNFLWTVPVRMNGKDGMMVVDTAAATTVIDESFAKLAGIELKESEAIAIGAGDGAQKLTTGIAPDTTLANNVNLGDIEISGSNLEVVRVNFKPAADDAVPFAGILGMDQLTRVRAVLDCKRGAFHCAREAMNVERDTALIMEALTALVAQGDLQATKLQEDAVKNNGALEIDPLQASQIIIRARGKGLVGDKAKNPGTGTGAAVPDMGQLVTAIQKLAESGDEEAKKCVADAAANGGKLGMTPQQAEQLVARAREKGLLGK